MLSMILLAAAKPWTYWMMPWLLAANLILLLCVLAGYYRKVAVPRYQRSLYEAELRRQEDMQPRRVSSFPPRSRDDEREVALAA